MTSLEKPPPAEVDDDAEPSLVTRLVGELAGAVRFVSERPPTLAEYIAYARRGWWTTEIGGGRRSLMELWMRMVAIPTVTVCYLLIWQVSTPGRCVGLLAVELALGTLLDQLPVVSWFVPDLFDVATWWPFTLL